VLCESTENVRVLFQYGTAALDEVLSEVDADPAKVIERGSHLLMRVLRCRRCDLVYSDENLDAADLTAFYEKMGDIYEFYTYDEAAAIEDKTATIEKYAGSKRGRLLDVGCARGDLLHSLRQCGFDCYGVDISAGAVAIGRKQYGLTLFAGTLEAANYPDAFFDWVSAGDVIEHLQNPLGMIREIARILAPGGRAIIEVPCESTIFRPVARTMFRLSGGRIRGPLDKLYNPFHLYYFSPKSMQTALERAGLRVVDVRLHESYTTRHGVQARRGLKRIPIRALVTLDRLFNMGAKLVVCAVKP
jgi:SAM-dependent methyltransferase